MNPPIKAIATATLTLLLNYSVTPAIALPQNNNHHLNIAQSPKLADTLIVPGERVGPVTRKTSKQDLIKLFGASRLVDKTISGYQALREMV